jgi:tripartite-type tricarboxylate transporter receptor subunit TctC
MIGQTYPARPIRLVLGFSPGSASDLIAKALLPDLERELGQPVAAELHQGEGGALGAQSVARSAPDGYALFMASLGTHGLAAPRGGTRRYDPVRDFTPVSPVAHLPLVLACHPSLELDSVAALIALARARPGQVTYASSAIGGAPHLAAELFQRAAQVKMSHVVYDNTDKLYADLAAGRVDLSFNNVLSMAGRVRAGSLRGLAVTSRERCAALPQLPTMLEAGVAGYEVTNWFGIVAPAGTPGEVVATLHDGIAAALRSPAVLDRFHAVGVEAWSSTPNEFAAHIERELARWAPIVAMFGEIGNRSSRRRWVDPS